MGLTVLDVRYPAIAGSVPAARAAFTEQFADLPGDQLEHAKILLSELVTNGVRHGADPQSGWVRLVVRRRREFVRIEVTDSGEGGGVPLMADVDPSRTSGWGLFLVDKLAQRWGVSGGGTTTVWCEIDLPWA
jgi:anti-sigma regulatory factor (Ser/Thr protein kinase)